MLQCQRQTAEVELVAAQMSCCTNNTTGAGLAAREGLSCHEKGDSIPASQWSAL